VSQKPDQAPAAPAKRRKLLAGLLGVLGGAAASFWSPPSSAIAKLIKDLKEALDAVLGIAWSLYTWWQDHVSRYYKEQAEASRRQAEVMIPAFDVLKLSLGKYASDIQEITKTRVRRTYPAEASFAANGELAGQARRKSAEQLAAERKGLQATLMDAAQAQSRARNQFDALEVAWNSAQNMSWALTTERGHSEEEHRGAMALIRGLSAGQPMPRGARSSPGSGDSADVSGSAALLRQTAASSLAYQALLDVLERRHRVALPPGLAESLRSSASGQVTAAARDWLATGRGSEIDLLRLDIASTYESPGWHAQLGEIADEQPLWRVYNSLQASRNKLQYLLLQVNEQLLALQALRGLKPSMESA
jgi:hypothetical protein